MAQNHMVVRDVERKFCVEIHLQIPHGALAKQLLDLFRDFSFHQLLALLVRRLNFKIV